MVWNIPVQRIAALAATVLFSSMLLSGCVADTPRTHLTWFPDSEHAPKPKPRPVRVAERAPTRPVRAKPLQRVALNCPTTNARPSTPRWYSTANNPPPAVAPAVAPAPEPATYVPPPAGSTGFAWPLTGPIIADYGSDTNGARNAGIDIAAPFGTPIRAAASGQISYAGNELRGYGNLVLIKHDDGYVTAYAHAERIVVNRGDYVTKGQIIGYAGQTGDVTSPQLHFEIRKGVTPLNPRSMLAPSRAS